ncbi:MAG: L,D-transpeptidase [Bacteroidota bacterium]
MNKRYLIQFACIALTAVVACNQPESKKEANQKKTDTTANRPAPSTQAFLTLPALDALFYEPDFSKKLKSDLGLTAEQIEKLKTAARTSLRELNEDGAADAASAKTATQQYEAKIREIIGADKFPQLQELVAQLYGKGLEGLAPARPNFVPTDTRIVVNAPAFRMDVFQEGKLIKSYKVGIGYPEFPLPTGMRRADTLIFNPSWTPPDEPWVKGKFQPGKKVSGSSDLNPLGVIKIPIGLPSLIHGGKQLEKIGSFASHGCVGLTNTQVKDFTATLAKLGGSGLTSEKIASLIKLGKTKSVNLSTPVPVDLRYETIVAENGSLHIYRDVYERGTNSLDEAKRILSTYNVKYESLTEQEKTDLNAALAEMNRDPKGNTVDTTSDKDTKNGVAPSKIARAKQGRTTTKVKGEKEMSVAITALQGKGYPAPVDLNSGQTVK